MILTPHAIIGAAVSNIFPNHPEVGFILAYLSHYAMDAVPHNHYKINSFIVDKNDISPVLNNKKTIIQLLSIIFDFLAGTIIAVMIFSRDWHSLFITLIGVAGGVMPDFFQFLYFKYKKQPFISLQKFHKIFEHKPDLDDRPITGTLIQILVVMLFVFFSLWISM